MSVQENTYTPTVPWQPQASLDAFPPGAHGGNDWAQD